MACGDPEAGARVALLDPELTLTQPRRVTALTGLDALVHALETLVTTKRNAESERHARRSFSLINGAFQGVLDRPSELAARADMQRAAAHAGAAIEHSMLGAAHACANPLTSRFELAHGAAVALMLPSVMRFNAADSKARELYASVARDHRLEAGVQDQYGSASALIRRVEQLIRAGGVWLKGGPAAYGVDPDALDSLARDAQAQWTGQFNPRPLSEAAIVGLYRDAFEQT